MARFASECLAKMNDRVKHLEAQLGTSARKTTWLVFANASASNGMSVLSIFLGPDTGDLTIRVGLHSGAGEKDDCIVKLCACWLDANLSGRCYQSNGRGVARRKRALPGKTPELT